MRAWKPCAADDDHSGNGGSANAKTLVLPRFSNDFALELTPSPGASPTHGQGTVTACSPRNADFVCFPNVFERFLETMVWQGNYGLGTVGASAGKARISNVFAHFQDAALRRLGRGHFIVRNPFGVCPHALTWGSMMHSHGAA